MFNQLPQDTPDTSSIPRSILFTSLKGAMEAEMRGAKGNQLLINDLIESFSREINEYVDSGLLLKNEEADLFNQLNAPF